MAAWLIAAIECLPSQARRVILVVTAALILATAIAALTLQAGSGGGARLPSARSPVRPSHAPLVPMGRAARPPVSGTELQRARRVAARFLETYLQFAYGRAGAASVSGIIRGLRRRLGERAPITPAERRRHPSVVSLQVIGTTPGFAVATAMVEDGGISAYRLRFTLQRRASRWAVGSVGEG
jgi:hypothetical protein